VRAQARQVAAHRVGREIDEPALGVDHLAKARHERPEIDAVRRLAHRGEREPVGPPAEAVAVRTERVVRI
jgi:hypothetical protein